MNLTKSKLVMGIASAAVAISFALTPVMASADTASDLQAQINSLLATIQSLQAQLAATTGGSTMSTGFTFNTNLTVGSTGTDVMNLQKVLNMSADTQVASGSSNGAPGHETSYFGPATKAAVAKFQVKNGITPAVGYVGPVTRAKLNSMSTGGTTTGTTGGTTTPVVGGSLVFNASTQPANSLAPVNAARVPFTSFTLTNTGTNVVTVNGVTVQRTGLAQDAVFAGVVLIDSNNVQIGTAKTFNSNHQATVGDTFTLNPGETKMLTVAGNMNSNETAYAGQVVSISIVGVNSTATVSGSFPVTGAAQTINQSLTVGSATINTSSFDPLADQTRNLGDTGIRFTGIRFTANSAEDLKLYSLRWRQVGTASAADISNIVTVVNGTSYPTTVSADGKYYTSVFPGGILIPKGNAVDAYIQGDVTGTNSASRTVIFDIDKVTDIYFVGQTYGYGVTPATPSTNNNTTGSGDSAFWSGYKTTLNAGSATLIGKANEVPAQNIAVNVPNQVLGGFATNFAGEPVSVQSMYFAISTTTTNAGGANSPYSQITSVSIVDQNGAVVAGPVDAQLGGPTTAGNTSIPATSYGILHFTDTVTFPVGRHVYTLKGKIPSGWANGTTVTLYTKPSADWTSVTGQTSGNTVSLSTLSSAFSLNQMTVKSAQLTVNVSTQPTSQSIVAGAQNQLLANFQLDASQSGEDIRLSSLPVDIAGANAPTDLTGCYLWNGSTQLNTGSRVLNNPAASTVKQITFDNSLTIPKGTIVTLGLTCNVSSAAANPTTYQELDPTTIGASSYTITGVTSGNTVGSGTGLTLGSAAGGTMSVNNGSLTLAIDAQSPSYALVAGGSTGVTMSVMRLRATNEAINLNKLGLKLTATNASAADVTNVYLYNGSTLIGTATFTGGNTTATSTFSSPLALAANTDVYLTVKADLSPIGTNQPGTEGKQVKVDALNAEGTGASSGITILNGAATGSASAGVRVFHSYPTVALDSLGSTGVGDGRFMRFKVTASNAGPVGLEQFILTLATSTASNTANVSNVSLYAYTDNAYSSPISTQTNGQIGQAALMGTTCGGAGNSAGTQGCASTGTGSTNLTTLTAIPTTPIEVPAGSTLYFELRGSITGVQSGSSVVATLKGDAAYPTWLPQTLTSPATTYYVATSSAVITNGTPSNFVWSGNATSTAGTADVDWSNGYGVAGLSSSGLIQTRSN